METVTLLNALQPEKQADEIINMWTEWKMARTSWEREMLEIRNYLYATSTRTTEVDANDFSNSTTIPKLSQIAMNLKANYSAHLFGSPDWVQFEALDREAASKENRQIVTAYARTKMKRGDYEGVLDTCLDDWLATGEAYARQSYTTESGTRQNGDPYIISQGPVLKRIPTADIAFDITAASFKQAAKIIRSTFTLGDLAAMAETGEMPGIDDALVEKIRVTKMMLRSAGNVRVPTGVDWKSEVLTRDGFGNMLQYSKGEVVEIHEFFGNMYDMETGTLMKNHHIVVVDRKFIVSNEPIQNPNGSQLIYHSGWEGRPDNLMSMGPLNRLVGMQYKLDKLENMRADIFDQIAYPDVVEKGDVEFHGIRGQLGGRYVVDEKGDVQYLRPDATILNADFQIDRLMQIMEEMAGSPRNATGFRTPGEKTKFEVQVLDNGGNRIFREKTKHFERNFVEEILNDMIMLGHERMGDVDLISTFGVDKVQTFLEVSKSDLNVSGKLRARGSSLFAEKANALQNLMELLNNPNLLSLITAHVSRINLANAVEELADLGSFNIILEGIGLQEDSQMQKLAQKTQAGAQVNEAVDAEEQEVQDEGEQAS